MLELLNPINYEELKEKIALVEPFPHFCIDDFLREDYAEEIYQSFPSFQEAQRMGRQFSAVNEKGKVQITDSGKFPPAIKKLNDLLASSKYVEMWSDITGIPNLVADIDLAGGGIHETNSGGHLDVHVDFNYVKKRSSIGV